MSRPLGWHMVVPLSLKLFFDLLASVGHLGVAVLVLWRPAGQALALLVGLLSLDLFAWNFASFAFQASGRPEWHWLDLSLSPFSGALELHVVLAFVGRLRRFRWALVASYVLLGTLAAGGVVAFISPTARAWIDSQTWTTLLIVTVLPGAMLGLGLLTHHLSLSRGDERARAIVMLAAVLIGTSAGLTDLLDDFGLAIPPMSNVGSLTAMSLMAFIVVRLRFLERAFPMTAALRSIGVAVVGLGAYVGVVLFADKRIAIVVVAGLTVALALLAVGRRLFLGWRAERLQLGPKQIETALWVRDLLGAVASDGEGSVEGGPERTVRFVRRGARMQISQRTQAYAGLRPGRLRPGRVARPWSLRQLM